MDLKLKDNSKLKLATFTQLEYIESTGTQYIDTGIIGNKYTIGAEADVMLTQWSDYEIIGIGSYMTNSDGSSWGGVGVNKGNSQFIKINSYLDYTNLQNCVLNTKYRVTFNTSDNNIYINGALKSSYLSGDNAQNVNFLLFASNASNPSSSSTNITFHKIRIYNYKVYLNHILVRNFVPALYNSTPCMYDLVSETFFYNQGTGDFIAGPVVKQTLPETTLLKTTTLYHKNTPNVDGLALLNNILNAQETAEDVVLNRIRVDIGSVSGPISELLRYAGMAGFNDNYEPQTKPRLVGTWTINDWYTTAQLAQAQAAFDGLTIVGDPNYVIDFNQIAVQVLDPNEDNYNPAVAIILQGQGLGATMTDAPLGHGRWFMSKTQAAAVTTFPSFIDVTIVNDSNLIIANDIESYEFNSFDEFKYFTALKYIGNNWFRRCTLLRNITIPLNIEYINPWAFWDDNIDTIRLDGDLAIVSNNGFMSSQTITNLVCKTEYQYKHIKWNGFVENLYVGDVLVTEFQVASDVNEYGGEHVRALCIKKIRTHSNVTKVDINNNTNVTTIGLTGSGKDVELPNTLTTLSCVLCSNLRSVELPSSLTTLGYGSLSRNTLDAGLIFPTSFTSFDNNTINYSTIPYIKCLGNITTISNSLTYSPIQYLHLLGNTTPPTLNNNYLSANKIYVGDGSSATHDDAILADYLADTNWATYSSKLDTWYNYLHPTT